MKSFILIMFLSFAVGLTWFTLVAAQAEATFNQTYTYCHNNDGVKTTMQLTIAQAITHGFHGHTMTQGACVEVEVTPTPEVSVTPEASASATPTASVSAAPPPSPHGDGLSDGRHQAPDGLGCAVHECKAVVPLGSPNTGRAR